MVNFSLIKKLHAAEGTMHLDVNCVVETGQLVSLYGASGAGKTSVLRMLAGFMQPDEGVVVFNDEVWHDSNKKVNIPPQKRNIGFVFQDYALFPNMNVRQNLVFALQKGQPPNIINELLAITGLAELQDKKIQSLSGGQKQRIALARALVRRPKLLLLDEPLSAIDKEMREHLQDTLLQIHRMYNLTTVLVTHDIPEIVKLCDKTICLEDGKVKDYRTPAEIFFNSDNHAGLTLNGIVLSSAPKNAGFITTLLIGGQVVKIDTAQQQQKGDKLTIQAKDFKVEKQ